MDEQVDFYECILAGIALRKAARRLRPAFPKKRNWGSVSVTWGACRKKLEIGVPGAVVETACLADRSFTAQIPFAQFKALLEDRFPDEAIIRLGFAAGHMRIGNLVCSSDDILITAYEPMDQLPNWPRSRSTEDETDVSPPVLGVKEHPLDSALDGPLIGAYKMLRQIPVPDPTMAVHSTSQARVARRKVEGAVRRASKNLEPLGVSLADLERFLDKRLGVWD